MLTWGHVESSKLLSVLSRPEDCTAQVSTHSHGSAQRARPQRAALADRRTFVPHEGAAGFLADHGGQLGWRSGQLWRLGGQRKGRRTGGVWATATRRMRCLAGELGAGASSERMRWPVHQREGRGTQDPGPSSAGTTLTLDGTTPHPRRSRASRSHRDSRPRLHPRPDAKMSDARARSSSSSRSLISIFPALAPHWEQAGCGGPRTRLDWGCLEMNNPRPVSKPHGP